MQPQSLQAWQRAERLLNAQQLVAARDAYTALIGDPDVGAMAHLRLSLLAGREGRVREATAQALQAWEARKPDPDLLAMIAKRLFAVGELELAAGVATYDAVLTSGDPSTHAELGNIFSPTLPSHALQLVRRARELGLDTAKLRYLEGLSLMQTGETDAAQTELEAARALQPDLPHPAWSLAKLRTWTDADNHVEQLRADIARIGEDRPESALFHYALFKELDDLGRTDEAWPVLETAMRLRRANTQYDAAQTQALFNHLLTLQSVESDFEPNADDATPIFIVGMPRSGSTLLERILGAHPEVADAGELFEFTQQLRWMADRKGPPQLDVVLAQAASDIDFAELGRRYLDHTRWRTQGRAYFTDKLPLNFLNVGFIARALPHAKFIHLMRDPMDTCFSNLGEHFATFYAHTYDQQEMADYYKGYRQLMAHWRRLYPDRILDVRYGELTIDTKRVVGDILEFLGLPWNDAVLPSVKRAGKGRWRKYEAQLAPMRERLGSYGYSARD